MLFCAACALFQRDRFGVRETSFDALSGWQQDDHAEALAAFMASCPLLAGKAQPVSAGSGLQVPANLWQSLCDEAGQVPPGDEERARARERGNNCERAAAKPSILGTEWSRCA